jgi:nucleotide-binding universal stress UspA family protein
MTPRSDLSIVAPQRRRPRAGPVIVALDDDGNAANLLLHGSDLAARLGVALRVVYVWTACRPPECSHHRRCHADLCEASRLLTDLLEERTTAGMDQIEREVVHYSDPAEALVALSDEASYLVMGASSDDVGADRAFGRTTRSVLGRARCPLLVVPCRPPPVTRTGWWSHDGIAVPAWSTVAAPSAEG